jgi:hypothetical protein
VWTENSVTPSSAVQRCQPDGPSAFASTVTNVSQSSTPTITSSSSCVTWNARGTSPWPIA